MKAFGCSPMEWEAMPEGRRAELLAHEMERNLREAYATENLSDHAMKDESMPAMNRMAAGAGRSRTTMGGAFGGAKIAAMRRGVGLGTPVIH